LKQLLNEHRSVLEKIMYKYRQHVQQLIMMDKKETIAIDLFNTGLAQQVEDKSSKIHEMACIMRKAIDIDDTNIHSQEERINALLLENKGLKEMLTVHGHIQQCTPHHQTVVPPPLLITTAAATQPPSIQTSVNNLEEVTILNPSSSSTTTTTSSSSSSSS